MKPREFRRLEEIFHAASAQTGASREEFLREACKDDSELRREIEALLASDAGAESAFLASPAANGIAHRHELTRSGESLGDYEILEEISRGGMGVVYRARQKTLDRIVALKVIGRAFASDEETARFDRETHAIASLDHASIVPIHEVGERGDVRFYSMKFMEGGTLQRPLTVLDGSPRAAALLMEKIARAVHHAHERGVLHRDLKPANVLLDLNGEPHVSDFGLAKHVDSEHSLTVSGQLLGTVRYMSPEQASGRHGEVSIASDVYGLGAIFYYLLTGDPPFRSDSTLQTLEMVVRDEPHRPRARNPAVPLDLESICLKCLEKSPARRYRSAAALADDLRCFLDGYPVAARSITRFQRAGRWCRRHPATATIVALLVVVAAGSSLTAIHLAEQQRETRGHLRTSLLQEARNAAGTGSPGQRLDGLDAIRRAADIGSGKDLRDAAVACLALPDLEAETPFEAFTAETNGLICDADLMYYARGERDGTVSVCPFGGSMPLVRIRIDSAFESDGTPRASPPLNGAWAIAFSRGGRLLAARDGAGDADGKLWIFDWREEKPVLAGGHDVYHHFLDFSPDDSSVAFVDRPARRVRIVEIDSGRTVSEFPTKDAVLAVAFSPDGRFLAHGDGFEVVIRDLEEDDTAKLGRQSTWITSIDWHPNGRILAIAAHSLVSFWEWPSRRRTRFFVNGPREKRSWIRFSHDGELLATTGWDSGVRLWNLSGNQLISSEVRTVDRIWFSHDDERLGVWRRGRKIGAWRVRRSSTVRDVPGRTGAPASLSVDPRGRLLAFSEGQRLLLWDVPRCTDVPGLPATLQGQSFFHESPSGSLSVLSTGTFFSPMAEERVESEQGAVSKLRIGPPRLLLGPYQNAKAYVGADGRLAGIRQPPAAGSPHPALAVVEIASGKVLRSFVLPRATWWDVAPAGKWFAAGPLHGTELAVWNVVTGERVKTIPSPTATFCAAPRFSPDGRLLVISTEFGLSGYRTGDWTQLPELERTGAHFSDHPGAIAIDPTSRILAWNTSPTHISLTRLDTGTELVSLRLRYPLRVLQLEFSADGGWLVVMTRLSGIEIWDLRRLRENLESMHLDWDAPDLPSERVPDELLPVEVEIDFGEFGRRRR